MQRRHFRLAARLSALVAGCGALVLVLAAPAAGSVDAEAILDAQSGYLEGLMIRHDVRYALETPVVVSECGSKQKERG